MHPCTACRPCRSSVPSCVPTCSARGRPRYSPVWPPRWPMLRRQLPCRPPTRPPPSRRQPTGTRQRSGRRLERQGCQPPNQTCIACLGRPPPGYDYLLPEQCSFLPANVSLPGPSIVFLPFSALPALPAQAACLSVCQRLAFGSPPHFKLELFYELRNNRRHSCSGRAWQGVAGIKKKAGAVHASAWQASAVGGV